jgi:SAM-dependent methyltransferase
MTGPAGDFDYTGHGDAYRAVRSPDPRIAAQLLAALGAGRSVLNVGAGTGSYEPQDRLVIPVEPSAEMRARRPAHLPPALALSSAAIPLDDGAVDAAMSVLSVHHWPDLGAGLREMRRIARGPVVILTFDPAALEDWWLADYCPEVLAVEARRYPPLDMMAALLGGQTRIIPVPVTTDCTDGFSEAFFARPEAFLRPEVLAAQSAWGFVDSAVRARFQGELAADLSSGVWDRRYGAWRRRTHYDGAVRILVATP